MAAASISDDPGLLRTLAERRSVLIAMLVFGLILAAAILAPLIAPADPAKMAVRARLSPPFGDYLLGADAFGRDVASRLLYAGRVSLLIGVGTALVATVAGIAIGLLAGFFSRLDAPLSRLIDAMMAFPDILLAISLVAIFGGSIANVILALSIVYTPRIARIVRAATLVIRELPFVEAARALGTGNLSIMTLHILPNIVSPVTVQATFIFAYAMLAEAGLSFLGVGVDPSIPTWGTMVNEGRQYIDQAAFLIFFPGIAVSVAVLSLQLIGDGLRDALDPRLAKEL
ncbi:ABC transporter permease [Frigidibacter sp. ROC022]|uniref:ABC transporter permease n=1 Tax=Frigidibacter sp. ROC022 TaxID=2971796 RepID=UPI00215B6AF7|nr:ABC transporter permease [Frigidibacter sp. ROC022]MCR8726102.1 ABC transporter permease [Frigidibacter sp. ROC022]